MEIKKHKNLIVLLIAAGWVAVTLCGWYGQWFLGLCLSVFLMLLHMILGAAQNGTISRKLLIYPLLSWTVLWILGFVVGEYYSKAFLGQMPSFTVFGFHPSFSAIIFAYWVGGVLTLTFGLLYYSKEWLSDEAWDSFKKRIAELNGEQANN